MTKAPTVAVDAIGALAEPVRRALYDYVARQPHPVGRDEAAETVGVSRSLAAFHLDKLVEKGLLVARYERLSGRTGPGAGRPAKIYEPSEKQISVSIPFRSYEVVGDILLDALETREALKPQSPARVAAHRRGLELGRQVREAQGRPRGPKAASRAAYQALAQRGYEPYSDNRRGLRLRNCPFHDLARRSPELVCGLNVAFVEGLLSGLGVDSHDAVLAPQAGECCVHIRSKHAVE